MDLEQLQELYYTRFLGYKPDIIEHQLAHKVP